jgi:hypothetical protein
MELGESPILAALENCSRAVGSGRLEDALAALEALKEGADRTVLEALVRLRFGDEPGAEALLAAGCEANDPTALWISAVRALRGGALGEGRLMMNRAWAAGLPKDAMLRSYARLFEGQLPKAVEARLRVEAARASEDPLGYVELMLLLGNAAEAAEALSALPADVAASPRAVLARAQQLLLAGEPDEAERLLMARREAFDNSPFAIAHAALMAQMALRHGDAGPMLALTETDGEPEVAQGMLRLTALASAGRAGEAAALADALLLREDIDADQRLSVAHELCRAGLHCQAQSVLLRIGAPEPDTQRWLRWQLEMAQTDEALGGAPAHRHRQMADACSRLCVAGKADAGVYALWVHCLRKLGQAAKANELMDYLALQYPNSPQVKRLFTLRTGTGKEG